MKIHPYRFIIALLFLGNVPNYAIGQLSAQKLLSRTTVTPSENAFGSSVAASSSYLVVGEPRGDDFGENAGTVSVFSSGTGKYLRRLKANDAEISAQFGRAVAVSGSRIIVGCPFINGGRGASYLFDAKTGKQLRKLEATDSLEADFFGGAVALHGNLALVGAINHNTGNPGLGAAYLFDINTGAQLAMFSCRDSAVEGSGALFFGQSVALNGSLCVVGAFNANYGKGAVYVFDTNSRVQFRRLIADDGVLSDHFGTSVSLFGNKVLVGAPGDDANKGSAYLFSVQLGSQLRKFTGEGGVAGDRYGSSVALSQEAILIGANGASKGYLYDAQSGLWLTAFVGLSLSNFGISVGLSESTVVFGAPTDDTITLNNNGSAYVFRNAVSSRPLSVLASKGSVASGAGVTKYGTLSTPVVSSSGASGYMSSLTGTGGMATGLWRELAGSSTFIPRTGIIGGVGLPSFSISSVKSPIHNDDNEMVFQSTLKLSSSVTSGNNSCVLRSDGGLTPTIVLREGATIPWFGFLINSFNEVVQDYDFNGMVASSLKIKSSPSVRVASTNDSAVVKVDSASNISWISSEGQLAPIGSDIRYGQFVPRVSLMNNRMIWGGSLVSGPTTPPGTVTTSNNQALFWQNGTAEATLVARSGDAAAAGTTYRTFLASTIAYNIEPTFKVTLSGAGVTTANNEGIWRYGLGQVVRKGDLLNATDFPGVKISRLLKFWSLRHGQAILLVGLSGTGVTSANDVAVILANPYDRYHVLLREGAYTEGTDAAKIRTIQRVDVEPVGSQYVVLASLTGSSSRNQALFTGRTADFGPNPINPRLAVAGMKMRKGTVYDTGFPGLITGVLTKLTSMSITNGTDVAGAGAKGLGQAINDNGVVGLTLNYSNGSREIRKGVP